MRRLCVKQTRLAHFDDAVLRHGRAAAERSHLRRAQLLRGKWVACLDGAVRITLAHWKHRRIRAHASKEHN